MPPTRPRDRKAPPAPERRKKAPAPSLPPALPKEHEPLARLLQLAGLGCWELDLASGQMVCSREALNIYDLAGGQEPPSLEQVLQAVHPQDRDLLRSTIDELPGREAMVSLEHRVPGQTGERTVHLLAEVVRDDQGRARRLVGAVQDVTSLRHSERRLQLLSQVFESTSEGIAVSDKEGAIFLVNAAFCRLTGLSAEACRGRCLVELEEQPLSRASLRQAQKALALQGSWSGEIAGRGPEGADISFWLTVSVIERPQEAVTNYVWALRDISPIKRSQEQASYLAYHDALTGLPNRLLFNDRLGVAMAHAQRTEQSLAILFLDLDNFKNINDGLGHAVGDQLLKDLAERLRELVRGEDTVARLGGDEFILLLEGRQDPNYSVRVAQRILESLTQPFEVKGHQLYVTGSIGITIFPDDGQDLETLVANADMAMYRAKAQGRNSYCLFTPAMNSRMKKRMELEGALRRAVEQEEFTLHYQPKVELGSGGVVGLEALVRWQHPEQGMVSPGEFIPVAEDTGLIVSIGQWVMQEACRQVRRWHEQGFPDLHVSVNLSPRQFQEKNLVPSVYATLAAAGLEPRFLELEVTESMVMSEVEEAIVILQELARLGVALSMDDFGVGYSNLYYLKRFPMNTLKIDKSFVQDITTQPDDRSIVDTIINMSRSLKLKVIAEGVETSEQLQFLRELNCDLMQGYLFSRPLPAADITKLLASNPRLV
ncbi:MAG: EAL domain-containing protein [Thermodesulfobacteriota bacterium]